MIGTCRRSAIHLETRDVYSVDDELEEFEAWRSGARIDWDDRESWWNPFHQAVEDATKRGVDVLRARIVSLPPTDYIRYEHDYTRANVLSGEQVRWLPRDRATDIALPGNDFWLFDDKVLRVAHFSGDGHFLRGEITEHPDLVRLCASAFDTVWSRATDHEAFRL
nr:DUF6879 family protein [Nocardiopsis alba]